MSAHSLNPDYCDDCDSGSVIKTNLGMLAIGGGGGGSINIPFLNKFVIVMVMMMMIMMMVVVKIARISSGQQSRSQSVLIAIECLLYW